MREAHSKARKTSYGGIAQLGERLNGIQEVGGSIPLGSTIFILTQLNALYSLFELALNTPLVIIKILKNAIAL